MLVEKLADVTERAQVTVDAHIHLPSSEVSTGTVAIDPARVKRAAKLGLPEDASDEEIVAAKTKYAVGFTICFKADYSPDTTRFCFCGGAG